MLNYISSFYNYLKLFVNIGIFTFIFKTFLDTCVEKVTLKSKHGKNKQTVKARIGVAITYLTLFSILYFSLTPRVLLAIISVIGIGTLFALDKFDKPTVEKLNSFDKNKSLRFIWKLLYTIINIIIIIYTPIHKFISNSFKSTIVNKNNSNVKGLFDFATIAAVTGANVKIGNSIKKTIHELTSDPSDKTQESQSSMGDYIKNDKSKTVASNQKVILEETSTDLNNEMTTEVIQVNVATKLTSSEIDDFEKFNSIINAEMSKTAAIDESEEINKVLSQETSSTEENIPIDNDQIDKKAESEKLLKLFKRMNDIYSTEEQSQTDQ